MDAAWNGAAGHALPSEHHELQPAGRDLAAKIFISGQIAGRRPSMEALEQVIAEASQRLRGFPDESRGIAEAVMALLEDPKHERLMLLPCSPNDAEALWGVPPAARAGGYRQLLTVTTGHNDASKTLQARPGQGSGDGPEL